MLVMICAMLPSLSMSAPPTNTTVYVDPSEVSGLLPGEYFTVSIKIAEAKDVWSTGFKVNYAPYAKTIVATGVQQGDFLKDPTTSPFYKFREWFLFDIDSMNGIVLVGYTRLPPIIFPNPIYEDYVGVDGDGLLATITFKVVSAGDSPIELLDVNLHDSNEAEMGTQTRDGAYYGAATASLVRGALMRRDPIVGETQTFSTKVKNTGTVPVEVRAHWDQYRVEDGQRLEIYSGQTYTGFGPVDYEYIYVDEFVEWYYEWDGAPENVFGEPDGNYIEATGDAWWASLYSFEDITLGDRLIGNLILEGYTQYPNGYYEGADIDMYCIDPVPFSWFGSLWGDETWAWHGVRWTTDTMLDVVPALGTEEGLNGLTILIYSYYADADNPIRVDSLRIRVEFSKFSPVSPESYVIQPGETLELPTAYWTLKPDDVGKWITTCTLEYRYGETAWIQSDKVKTLTWWVREG
jgi:hypothetical protein